MDRPQDITDVWRIQDEHSRCHHWWRRRVSSKAKECEECYWRGCYFGLQAWVDYHGVDPTGRVFYNTGDNDG